MRRLAIACIATLVTACAPVHRPPLPFLERTYAAAVPKDTAISYEAQVANHILVVDGLADAYDAISQKAEVSHADAWRFIVTPMFRIRQLKDSSSAVRTPSFMPRASVEWMRASRVGHVDVVRSSLGNVVSFPAVNVTAVRVTLAHHSNGQAGCFRDGFEPIDVHANECRPIAGFDTNIVRLNRANGDFSSTFINFMVYTRLMNRSGNDEATRSIGVSGSFDWHPHGIVGALSDEQRELYGSWRLHGIVEGMYHAVPASRLGGIARVNLEGERAPEFPGPLARRIRPSVLPYRWSAELSYAFDRLLGAGTFVRWHDGQDYYNIGFVDRRQVFMLGLMLDMGGVDRIGAKVFQQ